MLFTIFHATSASHMDSLWATLPIEKVTVTCLRQPPLYFATASCKYIRLPTFMEVTHDRSSSSSVLPFTNNRNPLPFNPVHDKYVSIFHGNFILTQNYDFYIKHICSCSLSSSTSCHVLLTLPFSLFLYLVHCVDSHDLQLVVSYLITGHLYPEINSMEILKHFFHS